MEDGTSHGSPRWLAVRLLGNVMEHLMVGLVVFSVVNFAAATLGSKAGYVMGSFQLHIAFSVCGYQLLMVEAILSFSNDGPMGTVLSRQTKRVVHMVLASLGVISSLTGAILGIQTYGAKFDTAHGICGLTALVLSLVSCLNGFLSFFSLQLRDRVKPSTIKAVHTICGSLAVTMGLVTLILGLNKPQYFVFFKGRDRHVPHHIRHVDTDLCYEKADGKLERVYWKITCSDGFLSAFVRRTLIKKKIR